MLDPRGGDMGAWGAGGVCYRLLTVHVLRSLASARLKATRPARSSDALGPLALTVLATDRATRTHGQKTQKANSVLMGKCRSLIGNCPTRARSVAEAHPALISTRWRASCCSGSSLPRALRTPALREHVTFAPALRGHISFAPALRGHVSFAPLPTITLCSNRVLSQHKCIRHPSEHGR